MQGASLTGGQVLWVFSVETGEFSKALVTAEGDVKRSMANIDNETKKADKSFNNLAKGGLAVVASAAIAAGVAIARNIGSAVSRVDTLNQFPKVLQAMGESADDAEAATNKLSERLMGLPTALPDATKAVQNFIAAGLPVDKATEGFLALNNAFLSSGAGANSANAAMLQLNQALSRGSIEGLEWNSISANIPTFMKAISAETGKTRDELEELYKTNPEQLINDMIRLNTVGGGGLASLDEQAREATKGIGTSFDNMNNAITRGISSIMTAIGTENISNFITNIGSGIETAFNFIGTVIEATKKGFAPFVGVVQRAAGAVGGFLNTIAPLAILLAPFVSFLGSTALGFTAIATSVFIATRAMVAFRAVLTLVSKHPIIAALSIIVGLLTSIATFAGLGSLEDNLDNAADPANDIAEALEKAKTNTSGASDSAGKLAKQLKQIAEQEEKVRRDYRENLAELVQRTRDSIKTLTSQLSEEEAAYRSTYAKRLNDFNTTQAKEEDAHEKKTRELQTQIDFLSRYNNESNRRKLEQVQFALAKENAQYQKQTELRKNEYDIEAEAQRESYEKRRAETQTQLDAETALLEKHRDEVASIRDVILLDEIEKLKRSQDEQLASLQQQAKDAKTQGKTAGDNFASSFNDEIDKMLEGMKTKGQTASSNFWEYFSDTGANVAQGWDNVKKYGPFALFGGGSLWTWESIKKKWENTAGGKISSGGGGWSVGGFTGRGGVNDVAGAVHRGEYVFKQSDVNQSTGVPKPEALRTMLQDTAPAQAQAGSTIVNNNYSVTVTAGGFLENKTQQRNLANLVVTNIKQMNQAKGIA